MCRQGYQTSPDSGLILAGNRWPDPAIGRFLSPDPSGSGDNPYAYCGNNPVSSLDPLGLRPTDGSGGGVISDLGGYILAGHLAIGAELIDGFADPFGGSCVAAIKAFSEATRRIDSQIRPCYHVAYARK